MSYNNLLTNHLFNQNIEVNIIYIIGTNKTKIKISNVLSLSEHGNNVN